MKGVEMKSRLTEKQKKQHIKDSYNRYLIKKMIVHEEVKFKGLSHKEAFLGEYSDELVQRGVNMKKVRVEKTTSWDDKDKLRESPDAVS